MKKGQMEMVGLVIIIILITLGLLFMAQFALRSEPQKKVFVMKELAYSTISALMKTSVKCTFTDDGGQSQTVWLSLEKDLLKDCAEHSSAPESSRTCDNKPSCVFLNETIISLLDQTLGFWKKSYQFQAYTLEGTGGNPIDIKDKKGKGCPRQRDTSTPFSLHTDVGLVESVLYICD